MSYARGAIQRKRPPNLTKGQREYCGTCEGCETLIHTVGDPPRRLCVECVAKRMMREGLCPAQDGGRT